MLGATSGDREATFYIGLMMNTHCHADAAEQAGWFGDDISFKGDGIETLDMNTAQMLTFLMRRVGSHGAASAARETAGDIPGDGAQAGGRVHHHPFDVVRAVRRADRAGPRDLRGDRPDLRAVGRKGIPAAAARRGHQTRRAAECSWQARSRCSAAAVSRRPDGWSAGTGAPSSIRCSRICSAIGRPNSWTVLTRRRTGTRCSTPNRELSQRVSGAELDRRPGGDGRPGRSEIALSGRSFAGRREPGRGGGAAVGHVRGRA